MTLLDPKVQQFIDAHVGANLTALALRKNPFPEVDWTSILNQIAAKTKAKDKLPTWFATPGIVYPSKISVEQTSSEKTARYKSGLVTGQSLIDMTGGFGVDDFYFAKRIDKVVHCEMNTELSDIVKQNLGRLGVANIDCICGDSAQILKVLGRPFDWLYIDPSRRSESKGKVFMLADCLPNVPDLLDFYFAYAPNILIKTAPLLDLSAGLRELKNVRGIHVVALEGEVKELLWLLEKGYDGPIGIETVNLVKDGAERFGFEWGQAVTPSYGSVQKYLYEPNAAVLKSGGFDQVSAQLGLEKLHPHSHLYTSDQRIGFPGRSFEVKQVIDYGKKEMKQHLEAKKANITVRNFPETVENIRKKHKIKDGGTDYCFFTTDLNNRKIVLICAKI
ncbi:THUMP-like domain-containing protein [Flavobacterium caeni]|uniref:Uncharacterized protein n=1 Tax=Flavobacterium caeni TaxID=490189 RepID=A0A1G5DDU0_9FLAO|nr:SAM-dependent methyltransferase [Flavobacterium caeni]SCY12608.1 hypothetical protein SAMN02927903_00823 [Flavobacterium caeni]